MICNRRRESDPHHDGEEGRQGSGVGRGLREPQRMLKGSVLGNHEPNTESNSPSSSDGCEALRQHFTSLSLNFPVCKMGNKDRTYLVGLLEGFRGAQWLVYHICSACGRGNHIN